MKDRERILWLLVLAAAACTQGPTKAPVSPESPLEAPSRTVLLEALECRVIVSDYSFRCAPAEVAGERLRFDAIVGSQHRFVRLESSNLSYNSGTDILSADVTVQNMTLQPMATTDGTIPIAEGVRVFFHSGPTSGVDIANEDGTGTFTATNQPFFRYTGPQLGSLLSPGILDQGEVSSSESWLFDLNGATTFSFTVFVTAAVPDETRLTTDLAQVDGGSAHACGRALAGQAYCWGEGSDGQIGDGSTTDRSTPRAVQQGGVAYWAIAVGADHACGLSNGQVYCWGDNSEGELGNGSNADSSVPVAVTQPAGVTFASIDAGRETTCGLTASGQAYCWGKGSSGQLGNGGMTSSNVPVAVNQPVGVTFASVSPGDTHTCGLTLLGRAYCWGDDADGRLGNGAVMGTQTTPVAVLHSMDDPFHTIASGQNHTCTLRIGGQAYCWGDNANGEIGDGGAPTDRDVPTPVSGGLLFFRLSTNGRSRHTCGSSGGLVYCWGDNDAGQIGDGTFGTDRTSPVSAIQPGIIFIGLGTANLNTFGMETWWVRAWGETSTGRAGNGRTAAGQVTTPIDPEDAFVAATRRGGI